MSARAVVLDAAGTLLEVRGSVGEVYATLARECGVELDPVRIESGFRAAHGAAPPLAFGGLDRIDRWTAERAWWKEIARVAIEESAPPPGFPFDGFFERAWRRFAEPSAWRIPDDVRPALRALRRAGHPLAVFSNWDGRLGALLDGLGMGGYFVRVIVSSALTSAKPDVAAFDAARSALGELAAKDLPIMVGDRLEHDIGPARAAGWEAVWLDRRQDSSVPVPDGADRISDLRALTSRTL